MFWSHIVSISTNSLVCQALKKIFLIPVKRADRSVCLILDCLSLPRPHLSPKSNRLLQAPGLDAPR